MTIADESHRHYKLDQLIRQVIAEEEQRGIALKDIHMMEYKGTKYKRSIFTPDRAHAIGIDNETGEFYHDVVEMN